MHHDKKPEEGYFYPTPGLKLDWLPENYAGPEGTIAVLEYDEIPSNLMIFIKDGTIVHVWDRTDPSTTPDVRRDRRPKVDGVLVNTDSGPAASMGKEWVDNALAKAKKLFH